MATDENPRTDLGDEVLDQENFEVELSDIEDDDRANPETGTSATGASAVGTSAAGTSAAGTSAVEEMTDEELLRGAWQGSTITEEHILRLRRRRQSRTASRHVFLPPGKLSLSRRRVNMWCFIPILIEASACRLATSPSSR